MTNVALHAGFGSEPLQLHHLPGPAVTCPSLAMQGGHLPAYLQG